MSRKRNKCKMCKVKRKLIEDGSFFSVNCRKHFVPLVILNEHRNELTEGEAAELSLFVQKYYPKLYLDDSHSDSDEHWHIHLSKTKK